MFLRLLQWDWSARLSFYSMCRLASGLQYLRFRFYRRCSVRALHYYAFLQCFLKKCAAGDKEWKLDIVGFALILLMVIMLICSFTSVARENSLSICLLQFALMSFLFYNHQYNQNKAAALFPIVCVCNFRPVRCRLWYYPVCLWA